MPSDIDEPADYINLSKDEFGTKLGTINDVKFLRNKRREFLKHMRGDSRVIRIDFSGEMVGCWISQPDYLYLIDKRMIKLGLPSGIEGVDYTILDLSRDELNSITDISLLEGKKEASNDRLKITLRSGSQFVDISFKGGVNDGQKTYPSATLLTFHIEESVEELQKEMRGSKESDTPLVEPSLPFSSRVSQGLPQ
jgi:hypothetical protein